MKYLHAIKEIAGSAVTVITVIVDIIAITVGLFYPIFSLPPWIYALIIFIGFHVAAVRRLAEKNKLLEDTKVEIPMLGLYLRRNQIREGETKPVDVLRVRSHWPEPLKDIKVADVRLAGGLVTLKFRLDGTNILAPEEERDLIHVGGATKYLAYPASFDPRYAVKNYNITIFFKDSRDHKYRMVFNIGKNDISIKRSARIE